MISNANRSGLVRSKPGDDRRKPHQDDVRSGRSGDKPMQAKSRRLDLRRQKIIEVNGVRRLFDT
jgi:hypothetical protein